MGDKYTPAHNTWHKDAAQQQTGRKNVKKKHMMDLKIGIKKHNFTNL